MKTRGVEWRRFYEEDDGSLGTKLRLFTPASLVSDTTHAQTCDVLSHEEKELVIHAAAAVNMSISISFIKHFSHNSTQGNFQKRKHQIISDIPSALHQPGTFKFKSLLLPLPLFNYYRSSAGKKKSKATQISPSILLSLLQLFILSFSSPTPQFHGLLMIF